jgi:uncharacterized protein (TIGR03067 family)
MRYLAFLGIGILTLHPTGVRGGESDSPLARDQKRIQGTWNVTAYDQDGQRLPADLVAKMSVAIQADKLVIRPKVVARRKVTFKDGKRVTEVEFAVEDGKADEAKYRLAPAKKRKLIELVQDDGRGNPRKIKGLYALDEDTLTIVISLLDGKLPKKVPAAPAKGVVRMVLKRAVEPKPDGGNDGR